jgi:branched-chain amino acid transport system permease protein
MSTRHRHGRVWRALEAAGLSGALARFDEQPFWVRRAVTPVVIAVLVILVSWAVWQPPDSALIALLLITYALYVMPRRFRRFAFPATALTLAITYPLYIDELFAIPVVERFPSMDTMVVMAIFTMMAIGLNIVVGYAGLLDLGYVAFYALGAYGAAWFASNHFSQVDVDIASIGRIEGVAGIHISIWLVLLIAACMTAVAGVLIGLPTLRLRGDYLAIVTLGFGEILPQIARNGDEQGLGFNLTNGPPGINPIDPPGFGSFLGDLGLPENFLLEQNRYINFPNLMYWGAIGLVLIVVFCSLRLRDSRLGRAWIAIREDETAAAAMGIPLMRTKTWAYACGAFFGGAAGTWFAAFNQGVFPDNFFFNLSVFILCMVILGGMGNVWGVIAGAGFLVWLDKEGLSNIADWFNAKVLPCDSVAQNPSNAFSAGCLNAPLLSFGIYGTIIVLVMLFRPQGLFPEERRKLEFEHGVHDQPLWDARSGAVSTDIVEKSEDL